MARKEWAGAGRVWINGTLFADALNIDVEQGEQGERMVTTGGNTGTVQKDPTHMTVRVRHAVPKTGSQIQTVTRYRQRGTEVTIKVVIGNNTAVGIGKIVKSSFSTETGKSEFSFDFDGDEQSVG